MAAESEKNTRGKSIRQHKSTVRGGWPFALHSCRYERAMQQAFAEIRSIALYLSLCTTAVRRQLSYIESKLHLVVKGRLKTQGCKVQVKATVTVTVRCVTG